MADAKPVYSLNWVRFINGDEEAFRAIYEDYVDRLFDWGHIYDQDSDLIKDAIQDVFVNLYLYRRKLKAEVNVDGYLRASLRREIIRLRKKQAATSNVPVDYSEPVEADAEKHIIEAETKRGLTELLAQEITALPTRQREVLHLRYIDQLSYMDVSRIMKLPISTCRTLLFRAIRQLRLRLRNGITFLLGVITFLFS